jgi:hypothetical protein
MKYKIPIIAFSISLLIVSLAHSQYPILSNYCGTGSSAVVKNFAPWYCTNSDPIISREWAQYFPILFIAVTLSYTIAAVIFMFGIALRNDRLRQFGTAELYEATATAIMALMFTFIAAVMFGLLPALTVGAINPYDAALTYISTTINVTYATATNIFYIAAVDDSYTTFSLQGQAFGLEIPDIFPILTLPFYYLFFWPAFSIIGMMFEALISLYTQFYMITFFMYAAIPVFLIPGIIFRALFPTRNLGGMMMAIAIGFYFIMPMLFSVAYYFTSNSIQLQLTQAQSVLNQYSNSVQSSLPEAASPSTPLVGTLSQARSTMSSYWLSILFFPALILAMTYMIITQMAEILGGMGKTSSKLRALL